MNEIIQIKFSFVEAVAAVLTAPRLSESPRSSDLLQFTNAELGYAKERQMSLMEESTRDAFRALHDLAQIYYWRSTDKEVLRSLLVPLSHFGGESLTRSCLRCILHLLIVLTTSHLKR